LDYVYSKENRPKSDEDRKAIEDKYPGLHFRSALCSILYLAYNTRADILWITAKLAKACSQPGMKDYDALFHLFGYLRAHQEYAIKFYSNPEESHPYTICRQLKQQPSELIAFSDASWQDCPDTGRSTIGYMIFYQGGLVEATSTVPVPVAMSTCEAEYLGACNAAMSVAHLRMMVYDFMHLGTNRYSLEDQKLKYPPLILVDNQAAVQMATNDQLTKCTRHIECRFHYVREGQKLGKHWLLWVPREDQLSDCLTKTQEAEKTVVMVERAMFKLPPFLLR